MFTAQIFQFHKGAIRTVVNMVMSLRFLYFNSIKVRLEHPDFANQVLAHLFQFHKGAIRTVPAQQHGIEYTKFQFHKGAIRTRLITPLLKFNKFQFHKGAIRTRFLQRNRRINRNFNSIKVRLEHISARL